MNPKNKAIRSLFNNRVLRILWILRTIYPKIRNIRTILMGEKLRTKAKKEGEKMTDIPGVKQLSDVGEFVSLHTAEAGRGGYPYEFFFRPGHCHIQNTEFLAQTLPSDLIGNSFLADCTVF